MRPSHISLAVPCLGKKSNTGEVHEQAGTECTSLESRRLSWVTLCFPLMLNCEMCVESSDKMFFVFLGSLTEPWSCFRETKKYEACLEEVDLQRSDWWRGGVLILIMFQGYLGLGHELQLWFISLPGMRPFQKLVRLTKLVVNEVKLSVLSHLL